MVDEKGEMLGVMPTAKALDLAKGRNLDLVEVAPNVRPSIARIMDYGKYSYRQQKMARKQRAHRKVGEIKGVRIGYRTSEHDMQVQVEKAEKFIKKGHKVKVELILKGREKAPNFKPFIEEKKRSFLKLFSMPIKLEQEPKRTPRGLSFIIGGEMKENKTTKNS